MSGVFLSYSRGDRALAERIIEGLRALGVAVWWDEDMPGVDWQEELERQISGLACVVVLWTPNSVSSKNVRDEARLGLRTDKLVNVLAGSPEPPFPFDRVNGLPLDGWTGQEPHRGWSRVVQTIETLVVKSGAARPGEITDALTRRDQALQLARARVDDAEHAFQDAQLRESAAAESASSADSATTQAEAQMHRMVEMRASPAVMGTAQQELSQAHAAKTEAVQAQRAAKALLSEASLNLTRARTALDRLVAEGALPSATAPPSADGAATAVASIPVTDPDTSPRPGAGSAAPVRSKTPSSAPANVAAGITVAAIVFVVLLVVLLVVGLRQARQQMRVITTAPAASGQANDPGGTPNPGINGAWAVEETSCDHAIRIVVQGDTIAVGGKTTKIASVDTDGTVNAGPDNARYNYEVEGSDELTVTAPNAEQTSYKRCGR